VLDCAANRLPISGGTPGEALPYPATPRSSVADTIFGSTVDDPYRWLEPTDDAAVKSWSIAEDRLARGILDRLPDRKRLHDRLLALRAVDEMSAPVARAGFLFFVRRTAADELPALLVSDESGSHTRRLLDPSSWSSDHSLSFGDWWVSPDGTQIAYQLRTNGHDAATLRVAEVATGIASPVDDIAEGEDPRVQWLPDSSGFFYTSIPSDPARHGTRWSEASIRQHRLGVKASSDAIIFAADPREVDLSNDLSDDGRWLTVTVWLGWARSRVHVCDRQSGAASFHELGVGGEAKTTAIAYKDRLFVYTEDKAPNGKIVVVDPLAPNGPGSTEVVSERPRQPLLGFGIVGGALAVSYVVDATTDVEMHELDGRLRGKLQAPELSTVWRPVGRPSDDIAYYTAQSYTSPPAIYKYNARTQTSTPWFSTIAPPSPGELVTERVFYTSTGGVQIPMFIVRRIDAPPSPDARLILEGYGGFREVNRPLYRPDVIAWVQSGGVYAIACIRGGGEYGETWHADGMLHNKQNTFDDFAAAARYVVDRGYTSAGHLILRGASNGGLLVAATVTQHPDIAAAALIGEPLADMVRFSRFGAAGMAEYGNPEVEPDFRALLAYSPYHHVGHGLAYPAILVTAAEGDERAHPMHARKLAAALQAAGSPRPVLLRMDFRYAHDGPSSVTAWADKLADELSFAAWRAQ